MKQKDFYIIANYLRDILTNTVFNEHVFFVGGACRDIVMNLDPKDLDICVELENGGLELGKYLFEHGYLAHEPVLFPTYGTCMFVLKQFPDIEIEAVQTRKEQYKDKNSRNPECVYGTLMEDSARRDLSCNSLYYDISNDKILDPTGKGIDDINNHIIRTTNNNPDIVYIDDALRILRCIRFSCRYGWEIEQNTFESMKRNVDRLSIITKERIRDEFEKILLCKNATQGIKLLLEIGAMKYIIPELEQTVGLSQNKYHFGTVLEHTLALIDYYHEHYQPDIVCLLSSLLHDIGKISTRTVGEDGRVHFYDHEFIGAEMVESILRRLKYDNKTISEVHFLVKHHMVSKNFGNNCEKIKLKSLNKLIYKCQNVERFERLCKVIECDNLSHAKDSCIIGQYDYFIKQFDNPMFGYVLPITGDEIMSELGINAGVEIKLIKEKLIKIVWGNPKITKSSLLKQLPGIYKNIKYELIN
ncbi:MAG: HD domain-containing protein [Bacilli bacterium]|nr:HD domain-containing protein [Bacilli bacterium]